ncbi:MAG: 50S ribosomal protein L21 [Candidatus Magasanikbacteria bacterium]|nr:50S ribosomal protein L21 [Candidatus Magasanikbacteria bacterium]
MIAIIEAGGKQYIVSSQQKIKIEKAGIEEGAPITFDKVLLIADESGASLEIGKPTLDGKVTGKVMRNFRTRKIMVRKFKNKVRYRRTAGHRQHQTEVQIEKLA